eukprot:scaffold1191_cov67-Skeletonema_dohrnii-CCMP3373.AAC.1
MACRSSVLERIGGVGKFNEMDFSLFVMVHGGSWASAKIGGALPPFSVLIPTQLLCCRKICKMPSNPLSNIETKDNHPFQSIEEARGPQQETTAASSSVDNNNASESQSKNSYPRVGLQFGILSSCRLW